MKKVPFIEISVPAGSWQEGALGYAARYSASPYHLRILPTPNGPSEVVEGDFYVERTGTDDEGNPSFRLEEVERA